MSVVINITEAPELVSVSVADTIEQVNITIGQSGGGGAVDSVNGQTGIVVLDANDVGADVAGAAAAALVAANAYTDAEIAALPAQLTAGSDISIVSNQINNTAPDQIVSLTAGTGIGVSGTYPNFTIDNTAVASIPKATASGTDTYTATISGVAAYTDGDAYLIRFTNGNTTSATLNINALGAKALYRNNDGSLIGGDIWAGGEMLCIYNSTLNGFQCIGTSPNSLFAYITNADSVAITKGQPVYAFGAQGDRLTVKRALNTSDATSAKTIGVVYTNSIAAGQKGIIIIQGELDNLSILPTSTYSDGDTIYLGATAGSITNVKPYAPNHLVYIATCITASNGNAGRMYVRIQNGYEMDELHDVSAQSPNNNDGLFYNSVTGLWTARAGTKSDVGLGNVDNTSDANKPVSTATQTALNAKQNLITIFNDGAPTTANTGNTTSNLVKSILIPANTFSNNTTLLFRCMVTKTGVAGQVTCRMFIHTSAAVGGTQISTSQLTIAGGGIFVVERTLSILVAAGTGNGTRHAPPTANLTPEFNALTTGYALNTAGINWTTDQYINLFLQNTAAGDSTFVQAVYINKY